MELAEIFFFQKSVIARGRSVTPFFWAKRPLSSPPQKTASAAKPILACLYKTLTMGARRSCGQSMTWWQCHGGKGEDTRWTEQINWGNGGKDWRYRSTVMAAGSNSEHWNFIKGVNGGGVSDGRQWWGSKAIGKKRNTQQSNQGGGGEYGFQLQQHQQWRWCSTAAAMGDNKEETTINQQTIGAWGNESNNNKQTMQVNRWGGSDNGDGQGRLIAREEGKDGNDDQTTSTNTTTATSKQQST